MKAVKIEDKTFNVPQAWSECSDEQINGLLPLQLFAHDEATPDRRITIREMALDQLFPQYRKFRTDLTADQRWRLCQLVRWIWTEKIQAKPFAFFIFEGVQYVLPEDNFTNTSAIEIAMANIHYLAYTRPKQPDQNAVLQLIATLCRPIRKDLKKFRQSVEWNGDTREEYNTIIADERAAQFKGLKLGVVMAVLQYFEAMNDRFLKIYKDVYDADPSAEDLPPLYANGEGLVTTLMDVAKEGLFGDFEKVCRQNGHTVWMFLKDHNLKTKRANFLAERHTED